MGTDVFFVVSADPSQQETVHLASMSFLVLMIVSFFVHAGQMLQWDLGMIVGTLAGSQVRRVGTKPASLASHLLPSFFISDKSLLRS